MQSFPSQQDSINGDLLSTMEIQQLIRKCQQGDAEALGALYQTYAQRMRGVCRRYICPPPLSKACATPIASSGNYIKKANDFRKFNTALTPSLLAWG